MRIDVVAAVICRDNRILITQRLDNVHLARLWEFPGGKVEPGEALAVALQRELLEELGVTVRVEDELLTVDHNYPEKSVRLHFFNCSIVQGEARALHVADLRWVEPRHLNTFPFPEADAALIAKLRSE